MIPVITVVAADHGAAVVRLVAPRTNPDLVSPFVTNLGGGKQTAEACLATQEVSLKEQGGGREGGPRPHHVGTDGLGYHAAHGRLHGRGGRQRGRSGEQRGGRSSRWERGGSRGQDGDHGGQHGQRLGQAGLAPGPRSAHGRPGCGRPHVRVWHHLADDAVDRWRQTGEAGKLLVLQPRKQRWELTSCPVLPP